MREIVFPNILYVPVEMNEIKEFYSYKDPIHHYDYEPELNTWIAFKETPKGYWAVRSFDFHRDKVNPRFKKWILKDEYYSRRNRKRFVYETKEDALYSYYRKKLSHLGHLESKHSQIKSIIRKIETEHNIFGMIRPSPDNNTYLSHLRRSKLDPLKRTRPVTEFIEEEEMIL